jgi:hypothetical protein
MNSIIALPIAAAVPVSSPSIANATLQTAGLLTAAEPHPDAKLLELGLEYERLLAIEEPLAEESKRLYRATDRLRYEKMGIDPEDIEACGAAAKERYSEWIAARDLAAEEVGYDKAWRKMNRAARNATAVGRKILKTAPTTVTGLLVRVRVIETHDEIYAAETAEELLAEIKDFAKRVSNAAAPSIAGPGAFAALSQPVTSAADADLITLGEKFEPLLQQYFEQRMKWAYGSVLKRAGGDAAQRRMSALWKKMEPLAEQINQAVATSMHGLRAKTLAALWDALPPFAEGRELQIDDEDAARSLLRAAANVSGLRSMLLAMEGELADVGSGGAIAV